MSRAEIKYYHILSTFEKVDHSPRATAFLQAIMDRSDPDCFHFTDRDEAVRIAREECG